jgi:hypothetical protein
LARPPKHDRLQFAGLQRPADRPEKIVIRCPGDFLRRPVLRPKAAQFADRLRRGENVGQKCLRRFAAAQFARKANRNTPPQKHNFIADLKFDKVEPRRPGTLPDAVIYGSWTSWHH